MAKKLIEVALPLEEINIASRREKSMYIGKPASMHMWWAARSLSSARAVIFASLITDPGDPDYPWRDEQDRSIEKERARLHQLIVDLVQWENSTDEVVLNRAREEILHHANGTPPPLLDPFAGGGAIPLEAQRLGLEAHASDLNPVAVLINKAMIEIPPKFAGQPPVNPEQRNQMKVAWKGAAGLAEDVRYYGKWMRDEAERRIGHLYPKVQLPKEQGGGEVTAIAWLWARTVTCPNPACGFEAPLISSFDLSKKKGNEFHIVPAIDDVGKRITFQVVEGKSPVEGTMSRRGATCLACRSLIPLSEIRSFGREAGMGSRLLATVAQSKTGRIYTSPTPQVENDATMVKSDWRPTTPLPNNPRDVRAQLYGLDTFGSLFTERQLVGISTFVDLVSEVRSEILHDISTADLQSGSTSTARLVDGGSGSEAYADAVATYLALAVSRSTDYNASTTSWMNHRETLRNQFARQAIPMVWDYAEANTIGESSGSVLGFIKTVAKMLELLQFSSTGTAFQADASQSQVPSRNKALIVTDPPYYDNIAYADLSDFFYVWQRKMLKCIWPDLFQTLSVPKEEELVASTHRFGGSRQKAERFFEEGLRSVFFSFAEQQHSELPMCIYYAFKQTEQERIISREVIHVSTGWETMLEGLIRSGFQIVATWPMRTEMATRMIASGANALDSSIVLVCRVRDKGAIEATRQSFLRELRSSLFADLRPLQQANIAPVDLAQAAIGPGMAIYSKYSRVREASGDSLKVREALALINQVLDEVLAEQDEEYDPATRWAITWYEQYGMNEGPYGDAEGLARARNVSVNDMAGDGMLLSGRGKVRFLWREELPELVPGWKPRSQDVSDWLIMQRLAHAVQDGQRDAAAVKAQIDSALPGRTELARDLAYRAYNIAERKGWTREALVYNTLVQNWAAVEQQAAEMSLSSTERQAGFDL